MRNSAHCSGIEHNLVCIDERILVHMAEDVASGDMISELGAGYLSLEAAVKSGCERSTLIFVGEKSHWMLRSRASVLIPLGM